MLKTDSLSNLKKNFLHYAVYNLGKIICCFCSPAALLFSFDIKYQRNVAIKLNRISIEFTKNTFSPDAKKKPKKQPKDVYTYEEEDEEEEEIHEEIHIEED